MKRILMVCLKITYSSVSMFPNWLNVLPASTLNRTLKRNVAADILNSTTEYKKARLRTCLFHAKKQEMKKMEKIIKALPAENGELNVPSAGRRQIPALFNGEIITAEYPPEQ